MNILLFLAVLVVLIVVHELGHFLVAKFFKVRVDEFGIGYPPRAFTLGKIGETEYTLNWLPFGGFVRIFGESQDSKIKEEEKKRALTHRNALVQSAVLLGGVVFNALFAWVLFTGTFMMGAPAPVAESDANKYETRLIIGSVIPSTPAEKIDLKAGDQILQVTSEEEKQPTLTPSGVARFIQERGGKTIEFKYIRLGESEIRTATVTPAHGVLKDTPSTPAIGIAMNLVSDESMTLGRAMWHGADATLGSLILVANGLWEITKSAFTGGINWGQVAGPVGIVSIVGDASAIGLIYLLNIVAFISINLAVINLIPLPALDGGRLLFVIIEAITRRKIPNIFATGLNIVGFGLLIVFMLAVTYHDILRLITN